MHVWIYICRCSPVMIRRPVADAVWLRCTVVCRFQHQWVHLFEPLWFGVFVYMMQRFSVISDIKQHVCRVHTRLQYFERIDLRQIWFKWVYLYICRCSMAAIRSPSQPPGAVGPPIRETLRFRARLYESLCFRGSTYSNRYVLVYSSTFNIQ